MTPIKVYDWNHSLIGTILADDYLADSIHVHHGYRWTIADPMRISTMIAVDQAPLMARHVTVQSHGGQHKVILSSGSLKDLETCVTFIPSYALITGKTEYVSE